MPRILVIRDPSIPAARSLTGNLNPKSQVVARHDVAGLQSPAAAESLAVDGQCLSRATPQFFSLSHEQDLPGPIGADDVVVVGWAEQTSIRQKHDRIDGLSRPVIAHEIQSRGHAECRRLSKPQPNAAAQFNQRTVGECDSIVDLAPGHSCGAVCFEQIPFTRSHDRRVSPLQVREDRQVRRLVRVIRLRRRCARPADRNTIRLAQPKTTNSVDPNRRHRSLHRRAIHNRWMTKKAKHDEVRKSHTSNRHVTPHPYCRPADDCARSNDSP